MVVMDNRTETSLKSRVLIVAPNYEEGLKLGRCLNAANRFEAVILDYQTAPRADLNCLRAQLIVLAILEDEQRAFLALKQLRHVGKVPIVIYSTKGAEEDVIRGLETGASEYLVTPLEPAELAARLHAIMRRCGAWPATQPERKILAAGELEIHLNERRVFRNGNPVDLTPIEFRLLLALVRRPGQLVSHEQLLTEVWGPQYTDCPHYVRLYMRYLRLKIEDNPHVPASLISEWGMGYRFEPGEPGPSSRRTPVNRRRDPAKQQRTAVKWPGVSGAWLPQTGHTASHGTI